MSQAEQATEAVRLSRLTVDLSQLSSKQQKMIMGLLKEMGFAPDEVGEVVVRIEEESNGGPE